MTFKNSVTDSLKDRYSVKGEPLGSLAIRGGMWLFFLKIVHRSLGFIRTIVLARLLSPSDFGLFGIAVLMINFLENFSVTGINMALVQKREDIENYLNSAWTFNLLRSFALFCTLYFGAPSVADFFESPDSMDVIRALAFLQLLIGFENIGTLYFQKEVCFDKLFYIKFSGIIVNVAVAITMAFILRNVWALVYGALSGALVKTVMTYVLHPYRPRLGLEFGKIRELLGFGKWLFGSSILVFFITEGDDAFVGKLLGVTALGFYQMAYHWSNAPATEISNFVAQITFPVYSKMQDNIPRLRDAYFRVLQCVTFLSFPIAGLIFVLAPDFTLLFLGERWMPIVPAMQILAAWGLIRAIGTTTTQVFYASRKPNIPTILKLIQLVCIIVAIYPLTVKWGIAGTSAAIVAATLLPNVAAVYQCVRIVEGNLYDFGKIIVLPAVNTCGLIAVILIEKIWLKSSMLLFAAVFIGVLIYLLTTAVFNRLFKYDMWFVLRRIREEMVK